MCVIAAIVVGITRDRQPAEGTVAGVGVEQRACAPNHVVGDVLRVQRIRIQRDRIRNDDVGKTDLGKGIEFPQIHVGIDTIEVVEARARGIILTAGVVHGHAHIELFVQSRVEVHAQRLAAIPFVVVQHAAEHVPGVRQVVVRGGGVALHLQALNRGAARIEEQRRVIVRLRRKRRVHDPERFERTLSPRHDLILRVQPVAVGILPEGVVLVFGQARLELIGALLRARLKLRGAESEALATPGGDGDDAGRRTRTVQRCCRGALDHLDRLHVHRLDVLRGHRLCLVQKHAVHHEEGRWWGTVLGDAGDRGAEHDIDTAARLAARTRNGHTGHFTRNQIGG